MVRLVGSVSPSGDGPGLERPADDRYRTPGSFGGFGGTGGTGGFKGFGACGEVGGFGGTGGLAGTVVMGRRFFVMWSTSRYS